MKLSVSAWSCDHALTSGKLTNEEFIGHMAALGADAVDLNTRYLPDLTDDGLRPVKRAATEAAMPIAGLRILNDFGGADIPFQLEQARKGINAARFLGAPRVRVFSGWPADRDDPNTWTRMIEALRSTTRYAEARGIQLMLENHNHGGFLQFADEVLKVLDDVNSPWLRSLTDPGNFVDGLPSVEKVAAHACWLDFKIWELSPEGGDTGIDYHQVIKTMRAAGFDGYGSIEYEPQDRSHELDDVERAVTYFRSAMEA